MKARGKVTVNARRGKDSEGKALALNMTSLEKADSQVAVATKKVKAEISKSAPAVSAKKREQEAEDARISRAIEKLDKSSGVKDKSLANRLLSQATYALLPHWVVKDITVGQRLELAANALAEMEPSNLTEAMLANQMLAVNDAALLFLSQATLTETSSQQRDDNTERACKFLALYIQQVDAMQRLKGKAGRQKVTVEHVNVHAGGQAVVGTVTAGVSSRGVGDDTED